jgi:hypothetical protein
VGEKLSSYEAMCYATVLYTILGGGDQFGRGELASHERILVAYSGG